MYCLPDDIILLIYDIWPCPAMSLTCFKLWYLLHFRFKKMKLFPGHVSNQINTIRIWKEYIKFLYISSSPLLRVQDIVHLGSIYEMNRVRVLAIGMSGVNLHNMVTPIMKSLQKMELTSLTLSFAQSCLNVDDCRVIAYLLKFSKSASILQELNICMVDNVATGDKGFMYIISAINTMTNLRSLRINFENNNITDIPRITCPLLHTLDLTVSHNDMRKISGDIPPVRNIILKMNNCNIGDNEIALLTSTVFDQSCINRIDLSILFNNVSRDAILSILSIKNINKLEYE